MLIPSFFVADCSAGTVSREYDGFAGEREQLAFDAVYEGEFVTAKEVAASAAACE